MAIDLPAPEYPTTGQPPGDPAHPGGPARPGTRRARWPGRRGRTLLAAAAALTGVVALLGACGSEDPGSTGPSSQDGRGGPGPGDMDMAAVQSCLKAAGIDLPMPTGTRRPGGTGTRPPESAGTRPPRPTGSMTRSPGRGGPGGDGGGMFTLFQRDDVKAALQACGITLPTGGGRPRGSASPTTTSS